MPYLEGEQKAVPNLRVLFQIIKDLKILSEETIFENCSKRYYDDYNYTEFGATAMISINPFKIIKYQTEESYMKSFNPNKQQTEQVHIYKFGAMAMTNSNLKKQVFLIQGESGAGKTKNCEILLKQIASFCNQGKTDQIILSSAPIMEAFGNAKTARNDNSSRFGKFLELNINESIISAKYQTYLLEQSRVIKLSKTDKNYHIFYQLLFTQLLDYQAMDFMYLKNGDMNLDQQQYLNGYHETLQCMKQQNFSQQKIDQIFDIIKGILFLGNLEFRDIGNDQTQIIEDENSKQVIKYFQMRLDHLNSIICTTQAKNIQLAKISRDSLTKFIYQNIFNTIVAELNSNLCHLQDKSTKNQIYLLDIFGFEFFEENKIHQNSFEQLNINYTNERLQKQYEKNIIQTQDNEIREEGIQRTENFNYQSNNIIIQLIDSLIYTKLNDLTCTDQSLMSALDKQDPQLNLFTKLHITTKFKNNLTNTSFELGHQKVNHNWFAIKHSPDFVVYTIDGFSEKNKSKITIGTAQSYNEQLNYIFEQERDRVKNSKNKQTTTARVFTDQLNSLFNEIEAADRQFYIKCIKPNHLKIPLSLDKQECLRQLRYSGVIEAVNFGKLVFEYKILRSERETNPLYDLVFTNSNSLDFLVGNTKIFFKRNLRDLFENLKELRERRLLSLLQRWCRKYSTPILKEKARQKRADLIQQLLERRNLKICQQLAQFVKVIFTYQIERDLVERKIQENLQKEDLLKQEALKVQLQEQLSFQQLTKDTQILAKTQLTKAYDDTKPPIALQQGQYNQDNDYVRQLEIENQQLKLQLNQHNNSQEYCQEAESELNLLKESNIQFKAIQRKQELELQLKDIAISELKHKCEELQSQLSKANQKHDRQVTGLELQIRIRQDTIDTMKSWRDDVLEHHKMHYMVDEYEKLKNQEVEFYKNQLNKLDFKLTDQNRNNLNLISTTYQNKWNSYKFKRYQMRDKKYDLPKIQPRIILSIPKLKIDVPTQTESNTQQVNNVSPQILIQPRIITPMNRTNPNQTIQPLNQPIQSISIQPQTIQINPQPNAQIRIIPRQSLGNQ